LAKVFIWSSIKKMTITVVDVLQLGAMLTLLVGVAGLVINRIVTKKGIGARVIQFVVALSILPTIIILALQKVLDGATIGTLIGGLLGYVLSGLSKFDEGRNSAD
jgi:hypothetical protein